MKPLTWGWDHDDFCNIIKLWMFCIQVPGNGLESLAVCFGGSRRERAQEWPWLLGKSLCCILSICHPYASPSFFVATFPGSASPVCLRSPIAFIFI